MAFQTASQESRRTHGFTVTLFRTFIVIATAFAIASLFPGCGGGGAPDKGGAKKRDKGGTKKATGKQPAKKSAEHNPASVEDDYKDIRLSPKEDVKQAVMGLGAKDEKYYGPAMQKLEAMGEDAVEGLCWGLTFPLQNLRARCCLLLSRMKKHPMMVPGAINALKMYPMDVTTYETAIRRWAAKTLADFFTQSLEENYRRTHQEDKDIGVKVFCALGLTRLGFRDLVGTLVSGLEAQDEKVAQWAADALAEVIPVSGIKAEGFGMISLDERKAKCAEIGSWMDKNLGTAKVVRGPKNRDPWPIDVEIYVWKPETDLDPEDEREVDLYVRDAENALAEGKLRDVTRYYAEAFRFSKRTRMDIALLQHQYWRQLGPDNADKSYLYLHEKLIPYNPLDEALWLSAARSALASGGGLGRDRALQDIRMALILNPDSSDALDLKREIESQ